MSFSHGTPSAARNSPAALRASGMALGSLPEKSTVVPAICAFWIASTSIGNQARPLGTPSIFST
jgi:hypothetical protein